MLTLRRGAVGALLLATAGLFASVPSAHSQPAPAGVTISADLTLSREGVLEVIETVTVPPGGEFAMSLPLRLRVAEDAERVFQVTDIDTTGTGTTTIANDQFTIHAQPGESTFSYAVHNTVSAAPAGQVFHWLGVINTDIAAVDASLISPSFKMGIVDCTLGPPNNTRPCADVHIEADGALFLEQTELREGDTIDLTLRLPPGTVPTNADVRDTDPGGSFSFTTPALLAFGVLGLVLAAMAAFTLRAKRENAAVSAGSELINPLVREGDRIQFASPDGVLPAEAGLLFDEHVDPVDIAAIVVDLAVRRYLWVTSIDQRNQATNAADWRIGRVNLPDDQLRDYEKAVYYALLPQGTDSVLLSQLRAPGRLPAEPIHTALLSDARDRGLIVDRTRHNMSMLLGGALIITGVGAAVALTLTAGHALVGVAIALAGAALVAWPRFLPTRTARGRALARRLRALQRGLDATERNQIPPRDQELAFSRALPFTVVSGRVDSWVRAFRDLDPSADAQPGLYWFGGFERDRNLQRFAGHFPFFITTLEGLFSTRSR